MTAAVSSSDSLAQAQQWLRNNVDEGTKCPCCTQMAKVYRRKITSPMARGLIKQYRLIGKEPGHTASLVKNETHEASQLSWWGLLEDMQETRDDGGRAGWWRITDLGEAFVLNRVRLPKYARIYDGRVLGFDDTQRVSITDSLGTKFNYSDLMAGL